MLIKENMTVQVGWHMLHSHCLRTSSQDLWKSQSVVSGVPTPHNWIPGQLRPCSWNVTHWQTRKAKRGMSLLAEPVSTNIDCLLIMGVKRGVLNGRSEVGGIRQIKVGEWNCLLSPLFTSTTDVEKLQWLHQVTGSASMWNALWWKWGAMSW